MLKIFEQTHMMVDVETLSTRQNAVIVQIGAVRFNVKQGVFDTFLVNIDSADSMKYNCAIDKETVAWWAKQDPEVRKSWQVDKRPLKEAMFRFNAWLNPSDLFWANGAPFDLSIIRWSMEQAGVERKWNYWNEMDFRTINTFFNYQMPKANNHNALADATAQANHLLKLFKEVAESE